MALTDYLSLSADQEALLIAGARDMQAVRGLTHTFYRYPARFSGVFARAAISAFTRPGDLVMDPYVGGGTTLVEALALGRHAVGVDISSLAEFVATIKTTIYTDREFEILDEWARSLPEAINLHKPSIHFHDYYDRGYYKHLDHPKRWRARKAIEQALESAIVLPGRLEDFGRCVVLRAAQTALDGRKSVMAIPAMRKLLREYAVENIAGARRFRDEVTAHSAAPTVQIINRTSVGIDEDERLVGVSPPRLVVTSPPYPGVHVLYHRWQVGGGRETAAPFWIAKKLDGAGSSYYTMGDRKAPALPGYFRKVGATTSSVARLCDSSTIFVQMLAFGEPEWQLPRYLQTMEAAGLTEVMLPSLAGERDGRLWRSVPNRKWYSDQRGQTPGSQEVVLFHRLQAPDAAVTLPGPRDHSRPPHPSPDLPNSGSSEGQWAPRPV